MKQLFSNGYVVGGLATMIILLLLQPLQTIFVSSPPVYLFLIAIVLAAWKGGIRAGLLTTLASSFLSAYFLSAPRQSLLVAAYDERLRIGFLVGVGGFLSLTISHLRQVERRALEATLEREEQLRNEIRERELAERGLLAIKEDLEQRVAGRTAELRAALQSLTERSRYLDAFFRHSLTPLVLLDRDFNFIRVNQAYADACGRDVDSFPGHNHFELYPSDARAIFEESVRTRQPFQAIARPFVFPDHPEWGTTYWNWALTPLLDERGEVEILVFSLENVTARKQAQLELEQHRDHLEAMVQERTRELQAANTRLREEVTERRLAELALEGARTEAVNDRNRLQAVMEALPVGVAIVNARGGGIGTNRAYDTIWGGPCPLPQTIDDYAAYRAWWVDTGQPVQPEEWAASLALDKGETIIGQSMEIARFDGARAFIHNSAAPIRDAHGRITGCAVAIMDISESVKNQRALRESENRLQLALEIGRSGTWDWNIETGEIAWSRGLYEILGYAQGEVTPSYNAWADRLVPEGRPVVEEIIRTTMANREPYAADFRVLWPDGSIHWMSSRGRYEYSQGGHCRRMIGVMADITERKIAEEALRAADRRKDEFLAMLGHELRNPLAPIRNAVQIMRKLDIPDPTLNWVRDVMDRQVGYLTRLVEDLLDVSRIIQGKLTLRKAPVEIAGIIGQAVETSRPLLDQRHHSFTAALPEEPLQIEGDSMRLAQAVSNLLNNAAKYTPEGGRISLAVTRKKDEVAIAVRDNGEGIPASLLPHVFDLFTQAERSLDRSQGGLGLGLTIVRNIVAMHGGRVEANSRGPGQGSEFVVRLPVCPASPGLHSRVSVHSVTT
jgi:PAS domain S-box-containing protein